MSWVSEVIDFALPLGLMPWGLAGGFVDWIGCFVADLTFAGAFLVGGCFPVTISGNGGNYGAGGGGGYASLNGTASGKRGDGAGA